MKTMQYLYTATVAFGGLGHAYPSILAHLEAQEASSIDTRSLKKRVAFDAASQLIDTTGDYAFVAPGDGDQRGPCPGLNAMANQ